MTPIEAYGVYLGLKNHFTKESYTINRYGYPKPSLTTFYKRKDRYFFEKLASKYNTYEVGQFLQAAFIESDSFWIGDAFSSKYQEAYKKHLKFIESMEYSFMQDIDRICDYADLNNLSFVEMTQINGKQYSKLINMYMSGDVSIYTMALLNRLLGIVDLYDSKLTEDIVWKGMSEKIKKCGLLLPVDDLEKYKVKMVKRLKLVMKTTHNKNTSITQ